MQRLYKVKDLHRTFERPPYFCPSRRLRKDLKSLWVPGANYPACWPDPMDEVPGKIKGLAPQYDMLSATIESYSTDVSKVLAKNVRL